MEGLDLNAVYEQDAVEVVDLVLHDARFKVLERLFANPVLLIEEPDSHLGRALHVPVQPRQRQTALLRNLLALGGEDLGIEERPGLAGCGRDEQPDGAPQLRRRKADSVCRAHRTYHLLSEPAQLLVDALDRSSLLAKYFRWVLHNRALFVGDPEHLERFGDDYRNRHGPDFTSNALRTPRNSKRRDATIACVSRFRIYVTLKPELLDPAGRTVKDALQSMGYEEVSSVRVGKLIELETANGDSGRVQEMCDRLLANPVVERFEVVEVDS